MKTQATMHPRQLEMFARFLEDHPGFWPELAGVNAMVCGFHVGGCFLTIDEMDKLVASRLHPVQHEPTPLSPATSAQRLA